MTTEPFVLILGVDGKPLAQLSLVLNQKTAAVLLHEHPLNDVLEPLKAIAMHIGSPFLNSSVCPGSAVRNILV
jgi:hypothetical protein